MKFSITFLDSNIIETQWDSFVLTMNRLTKIGDLDIAKAKKILSKINKQNWHIWVAVDDNTKEVIWTIKLQIEQKFQYEWSLSANIEEVVTRDWYDGIWIWSALVVNAIEFAKQKKVYKIILACDEKLIPFYEKFSFQKKEHTMKLYLK